MKVIRSLALCLAVVAGLIWIATGANRGWSKTFVERRQLDEVTGIEGIVNEPCFIPGLDFLAVAMLGAALLAGSSLLLSARLKNKINK